MNALSEQRAEKVILCDSYSECALYGYKGFTNPCDTAVS